MMNKRGSFEVVLFGLVAVIAVIGLVMQFSGSTGSATGQPQTRQVLPTSEEFRTERWGGVQCDCSLSGVYEDRTEEVTSPIAVSQDEALEKCRAVLESRFPNQPTKDFKHLCTTR